MKVPAKDWRRTVVETIQTVGRSLRVWQLESRPERNGLLALYVFICDDPQKFYPKNRASVSARAKIHSPVFSSLSHSSSHYPDAYYYFCALLDDRAQRAPAQCTL